MDHRTETAAIRTGLTKGRGLNRAITRFARDEDGHIVIFTVIMTLLMLMIGGMGVDVMNFETRRTQLQQTLDRSTLAAASMTQRLDPADVVRDYFDKAGLASKLTSVSVDQGLNYSIVTAQAATEITPIFLNLYDLSNSKRMTAWATSTAEQRINNVEIILVLDVSGSMAGAKLSNLKDAAEEFIDTVLEQDQENRVSIAIVPYNGQVNLPQYMQELYNRVDDHGVANVNCFDLPSSVYGGLGLSRTVNLPVTAHADTYSTFTNTGYVAPTNSGALPLETNRWCPVSADNVILAPTNNGTVLKNHIRDLTAIGATSINAGMKWGMALLDPSSSSVISAMVAQGHTPAYFDGRPFAYTDREAMKVVVLMTDGEHFAEERVNEGYRAGNSPIFRSNSGYSVYHDRANTNNDYYWPHNNSWNNAAYGTNATRQTWPQVWAALRVSYVARQFYARPLNNTTSYFNNQMNVFRTKTEISDMNTQLQQVCNMARDRNVIVYGIAFEAPTGGREQIERCASSPAHYFNAAGLEIRTVFRSIAANISQLKLTQ